MTEVLTTITPKYQVHIPIKIRELAGLKKHGPAKIKVKKSKIIIEPLKEGFLSLAGAFKVKNPIPAEKIRDYIDYAG